MITVTDAGVDITLADYKLETLQRLVGGLIEFVYFSDGRALMVNEEGLLKCWPINHAATGICQSLRPGWNHPPIVGPAVLFTAEEMRAMEGE